MRDEYRKKGLKHQRDDGPRGGGPPKKAPPGGQGHSEGPESDFDDLFQCLYDAAFITDPDGCVLDWNHRATAMLGYGESEFKGLTVKDIVSGTTDSLMRTILANLDNGFVFIEDCYCLRRDKSSFRAQIAVNTLMRRPDHIVWFVRPRKE